ncbi:MAG: hypothetical protein M1829_006847 [Trizodia sp. TS-e1964]|nr:MAG: hypothetical protein M1829_006847 [Trizodia sp. TS-e1964]
MANLHLDNDTFFSKLIDLFDSRKQQDHGSIFLTQKRMTPAEKLPIDADGQKKIFPDLDPASLMPILIRATNGKSKEHRAGKIKLSTLVEPENLATFYSRYAEVCKSGMQALKKRDRTGRKKAKAKKRKGIEAEKKV